MIEEKRPQLPIGYWIKRADEVLTACIDEAQKRNGLNRTEWQVLNLLHETSAAPRGRIAEILRPFVDAESLTATIDGLVKRGLIEEEAGEGGAFRLTEHGRTVHAAALETQQGVRWRAMEGITEADYLTTVRVLQQIVRNLTGGEEA